MLGQHLDTVDTALLRGDVQRRQAITVRTSHLRTCERTTLHYFPRGREPVVVSLNKGRSHRGRHGGRVPRAPYHVPLHQNDNRQFVFGADFCRVTWRYITACN